MAEMPILEHSHNIKLAYYIASVSAPSLASSQQDDISLCHSRAALWSGVGVSDGQGVVELGVGYVGRGGLVF